MDYEEDYTVAWSFFCENILFGHVGFEIRTCRFLEA